MKRVPFIIALLIAASTIVGCDEPATPPTPPIPTDSVDVAPPNPPITSFDDIVASIDVPVNEITTPPEVTRLPSPPPPTITYDSLWVTFDSKPFKDDGFIVTVQLTGVEDMGPIVAFQWDQVIPPNVNFVGILPNTRGGLTNGWAGIAAQMDPTHYKYGRSGGYTSSAAAAKFSGGLVDLYYQGDIADAENIVFYNIRFSAPGVSTIPLAGNPQIDNSIPQPSR